MICSCGARYPDSDASCRFCGAPNMQYEPPDPPVEPVQEEQKNDEQPSSWYVQNQNRPSDYGIPELSEHMHELVARAAHRAATISLVFGLLGLFLFPPVFGMIAIFKGRKAKRLGFIGGRATAGIVLGFIDLIFWLISIYLLRDIYSMYF